MKSLYLGSCHCGAVTFEVDAELEVEPILDCNCSMCRRKGILHLIVAHSDFRLITGADALSEYRFGTRTAVHKFCRTCGIHPFYVPRSHPEHIDVNVRCLAGVDLDRLVVKPFDGREWERNVESIR